MRGWGSGKILKIPLKYQDTEGVITFKLILEDEGEI
jgi:hypothetical protein